MHPMRSLVCPAASPDTTRPAAQSRKSRNKWCRGSASRRGHSAVRELSHLRWRKGVISIDTQSGMVVKERITLLNRCVVRTSTEVSEYCVYPFRHNSPVHGDRNYFQIFLELAYFGQQAPSPLFCPLVLSSKGTHAFVGAQHRKDALERSALSSQAREGMVKPSHDCTGVVSSRRWRVVKTVIIFNPSKRHDLCCSKEHQQRHQPRSRQARS